MRRTVVLGLAALVLSARPVQANAWFRPPRQQNPTIVIAVDENAKAARLIVPKRFLVGQPGRSGFGSLSPIMIGTALTMSLVLGGLWLVRHRSRPAGLTLPVVLALCVLAAGGAALWADVSLPFGPGPAPDHRLRHRAQPPPVTA